MNRHQLIIEARTNDEVLFVCPECGRRLVVSGRTGLTVLDRGDFSATHSGATPEIVIDLGLSA